MHLQASKVGRRDPSSVQSCSDDVLLAGAIRSRQTTRAAVLCQESILKQYFLKRNQCQLKLEDLSLASSNRQSQSHYLALLHVHYTGHRALTWLIAEPLKMAAAADPSALSSSSRRATQVSALT